MEENELTSWMQEWFERFMGRFDQLDKFMEAMTSRHNVINGERFLTDSELSTLLKISRRTLQEYRSAGIIPYYLICGKVIYKESEIQQLLDDARKQCLNEMELL